MKKLGFWASLVVATLSIASALTTSALNAAADPEVERPEMEEVRSELLRLRSEREKIRADLVSSTGAASQTVTGFVTVETNYRFGHHDRDLDTVLWFGVEMGNDSVDAVTGAFSGRMQWDMNGLADRNNNLVVPDEAAFVDYNDLESDRVAEQVYTGYVDFNRLGIVDKLRIGRQFHDGYTGGHFDGGQVFLRPGDKTSVNIYGGVPVNYYKFTGDSTWSSDRIYGGSVTSRISKPLTVSLDLQGVRDSTTFYGTHRDYNAVLGVRYDFLETMHGSLIENVVNGQQRNLNSTLVYWNVEHDLNLTFDYAWMPEKLDDLSDGYTPYSDILGRLEPYQTFRLLASKGLGENFEVGAELTSHELLDTTDETIFDKEWVRTQASLSTFDLFIEDLRASVHFDYWDSTDDSEYSLGGEVRQRIDRNHILEAGTYYSKFKYREISYLETLNVQTYFVRWRWTLSHDLGFLMKAELEDADDEDTYTSLSAGLTFHF